MSHLLDRRASARPLEPHANSASSTSASTSAESSRPSDPFMTSASAGRARSTILGLGIAAGLAVVASLAVGARWIAPATVFDAFVAFDPNDTDHVVIRELRVQRTVLGVLVGVALGLSGAVMQALTRNPLADPGLLGGRSDEAARVIADTEALFADAIAEHPEFAGATAAVTFFYEDQPGAYGSEDVRSRALAELGFVVPEAIDTLAGDSFYVSVSPEELSVIDTDVVVWIGSGAESFKAIRDLPTRPSMRAVREGREVVAEDLLSAAFSHSSPLSLEYVIEELVPELALALDGDPTTVVPSASIIAAG